MIVELILRILHSIMTCNNADCFFLVFGICYTTRDVVIKVRHRKGVLLTEAWYTQ